MDYWAIPIGFIVLSDIFENRPKLKLLLLSLEALNAHDFLNCLANIENSVIFPKFPILRIVYKILRRLEALSQKANIFNIDIWSTGEIPTKRNVTFLEYTAVILFL